MKSIEIIEMSPRDGLQNEKTVLATDQKVELIRRLVRNGVRRIEAVSFVHPKLVPAMADAEAVMERLPRDEGVRYAGLALNARGVSRAVVSAVDEIDFVIPITDAFAKANQNSTVETLIDELASSAPSVLAAGIPITVTFAVSFGCPYQGDVTTRQVMAAVSKTLDSLGEAISEIALADTIGCGVPQQTRELLSALSDLTDKPLRLHLHETRHTSIANAMAAVEMGVTRFDASIGGLGGCPFAPGAAGNAATEDLVWALQRQGYETGVDLQLAIDTAKWVCGLIGRTPHSGLAAAGVFPAS